MLAIAAKAELDGARPKARVGGKVGPVGETLIKCTKDGGLGDTADRAVGWNRNYNVVLIPKRRKLRNAAHDAALEAERVKHAWDSLTASQENPGVYSDERRGINANEFLRVVGPAVDRLRELVRVLNKMEG